MQEEKVNITLEYSFKVGEQLFGVAISFCQIFCLYEYALLPCKCAISITANEESLVLPSCI